MISFETTSDFVPYGRQVAATHPAAPSKDYGHLVLAATFGEDLPGGEGGNILILVAKVIWALTIFFISFFY
jgi:hypothetical protein